jgi:multidrug efflux system outer membrane protein
MLQRKSFLPFLIAAAGILSSAGCTVGPKYERATAPTAAKWDVSEPWRRSDPKDAIPKGEWWSVFHDDDLNSLEKDAMAANQTLQAAIGNYHQARAAAAIQIAPLFPAFGVAPAAERQRLAGNRPLNGALIPLKPVTQNSFTLPFTSPFGNSTPSWES